MNRLTQRLFSSPPKRKASVSALSRKISGFTIVELLIVIIVIAILVAVTVIGYSAITQKATSASLQSDLSGASTQLGQYKLEYGSYPTALDDGGCPIGPADNRYCLSSNDGNIYASYVGYGSTFTLTNVKDGNICTITDNSSPECSSNGWLALATGNEHTCAVASDNNAYCWGRNNYSQLGNNSTTDSRVPVAVNTSGVLSGKTVKAISAGTYHTCAIASDNQVYCWGVNIYGQLGNNSTTNSSVPVAVNTSGVLSGKTVKAISTGLQHTCAIASDNNTYCWGSNGDGQLGDNSTTNSSVPVAVNTSGVLSGKTVKAVSAGLNHTCAIASDNNAYCWGWNYYGQLGNNSTTNSSVPVAVYTSGLLSGKTVKAVSAGLDYACAIASDNKTYCWGINSYGQLGNNSTTNSSVPVAVYTSGLLSGKTSKDVSAGYRHTCAVVADNKAYCWGYNSDGQLGNNSTTNSSVPVAVYTSGVLGGKIIKHIDAGANLNLHTCAIATDNKAYCWGDNAYGQLGNNSITDSSVPVTVNSI